MNQVLRKPQPFQEGEKDPVIKMNLWYWFKMTSQGNPDNHTQVYEQKAIQSLQDKDQHENRLHNEKPIHQAPTKAITEFSCIQSSRINKSVSYTSIGSIMPWGNPGAEPTICTFSKINLHKLLHLTIPLGKSSLTKKQNQKKEGPKQESNLFIVLFLIF